MAFIPSADDFEDIPSYTPSASDFDEEKGKTSITEDIGQAAAQTPEDVGSMISGLVDALEEHGKYLEEHPFTGIFRTLGKMGEGVAEGGKAAFNLPGIVGKYLSDKDVPIFSSGFPNLDSKQTLGELAGKIRIGDTGVAEKIFGKEEKGDIIPEMIGMALPFGAGAKGASLLEKAGRGAAFGASQEQNPLAAALMGIIPEIAGKTAKSVVTKPIEAAKNIKRGKSAQRDATAAEEAMMMSDEQLEALKDAMYGKWRQTDPRSMMADVEQAKTRASELKPIAEQQEIDLENKLPGGTGEGLIPAAEIELAENTKPIQELLGKNEEHDVKAAEGFKKSIEQTKSEIGSMFDEVRDNLEGQNIILENSRTTNEIMTDLTDLIKKGQHESPEATALLDELDNLGKNREMPAAKFMSAWRTVDKIAKDTRSQAFKTGLTAEMQEALIERADELDSKASEMEKVLTKNVGTENIDLLEKAKKRWATEVTPLYGNRMFHSIMADTRINSANIMKDLRGHGKAEGILNKIASQDPEILKNLLGQKFADKPMDLLNPNKTQQRYINQVPELKTMIGNLSKSLKNHARAVEETQRRQQEAARVEEAYKEDVKAEKDRKAALKEYSELNKEVTDKSIDAELLKKAIANKKITKEEFARKSKELKETLDSIQKSKSKMIKITGNLLKLAGIKYGLTKLF